jgi:hypothetical protein
MSVSLVSKESVEHQVKFQNQVKFINSLKATSLASFNRSHLPSHHTALMAEEERNISVGTLFEGSSYSCEQAVVQLFQPKAVKHTLNRTGI